MRESVKGNLEEFYDIQENIHELHENIHGNIQENLKELKEKRTSMRYARLMAGGMCSLVGTLLAIYVAGWLMILLPLKQAFAAFLLGALTKKMVLVTALKCVLSLTTGGAIWCGGYILNRKLIGYDE